MQKETIAEKRENTYDEIDIANLTKNIITNKGVTKMKKQKIKRRDFYGEAIFNIAAYNCNSNYVIGGHNSKRALSSVLAITNYLHNLSETSTKGKLNGV